MSTQTATISDAEIAENFFCYNCDGDLSASAAGMETEAKAASCLEPELLSVGDLTLTELKIHDSVENTAKSNNNSSQSVEYKCTHIVPGKRYVLRDGHPTCTECYERHYANMCDECGKAIAIDSKDLSYKNKHWHEECFLCSECKVSLVDKPFGARDNHVYCATCHDQLFATRCDGCGAVFRPGMKKLEYRGTQWHEHCFACHECKKPIGTKSFVPKNDSVYCCDCYETKFSTKCTKCSRVIQTGGVTYKDQPYHRDCFTCTNCSESLAGQRFTAKDAGIYCTKCYSELFAKRCASCTLAITGLGGNKYVTFDDRNWHNKCFVCSQCMVSLIGKGFISDELDIVCADCAKARMVAQSVG